MKVVKIGGGCLTDSETIGHILKVVAQRGQGSIFVLSALNGITDTLIEGMKGALAKEDNIPHLISHLRDKHLQVARHLISNYKDYEEFARDLDKSLRELERYYYGLNFTREITPRLRDVISSYGERFAVELFASGLNCQGVNATYCMPEKIGLSTDGKFGDATANLRKTSKNLQRHLTSLLSEGKIVILPGFFGVSEQGDITTFGRGGSDYSAAVVAVAMKAELLEIWKDVDGFMSADPKFVPEAQLIPILSYEEAAELSYFGAKILHPRTVEPLKKSKLKISIKNTVNPDGPGSLITAKSPRPKHVIKSVAHDTDISIIKVHASGVGARPGILVQVAGQLTESDINIKSVVTSQTCISLLLARQDLEAGYLALKHLRPKPFAAWRKLMMWPWWGLWGKGLLRERA